MSLWQSCTISGKQSWTRLLGDGERRFYYDGEFFGTSDTLHHLQVEVSATRASHLINKEYITRTWNRVKQKYPLLAARIEELDDENVRFVVEEARLDSVIEGEIAL